MTNNTTTAQPASRQIARAAGTVMVAFLFTQLAGLVRGIIIYRAFGTSLELDSFNAANRVAEMLFNLMAGGALGSAFIPTFTGLLAQEHQARAWKLASAVANLLLAVLTLVAGLAALTAPVLVRHGLFVLAPEMAIGQEALTISLLRILLPTVVIFGLSGLVMGILNAHQRFWLPAIAPAMYSLGQIGGVLLLPQEWGIQRLALGALAGSALHLLVQIPGLLRLGGRYSATLGLRMAEVRQVLLLMGPRLVGVAVVQLNFIVNTIIALSLPEGSVSAITLAFTLMLMPQTAIAQSIAIAAMPTFSAQVALGKINELRGALAGTLRGILLLAIPATVGLILLRFPLIQFLYEDGVEFTAHSTELVAWALLWYAAGLVGHSLVEILARAFYALHDTRTPVLVGALAMALNVVFSLLFSAWFAQAGWMPHGGLALANSLATALEAAGLLVMMRRRLALQANSQAEQTPGEPAPSIWAGAVQAAAAALLMGLALWVWLALSAAWPSWLICLGGVAVGSLVYALAVLGMRVPETRSLLRAVLRQVKR
ncbi:MAG TPA: murein biosynthesis integral membrane protein MurJ [Anaerolineales bacterium]|nr:murein biosynthesis integral membrane protein MurJ [Anaerolineales bacterium]